MFSKSAYIVLNIVVIILLLFSSCTPRMATETNPALATKVQTLVVSSSSPNESLVVDTPTATPIPLLSEKDAYSLFFELLQTNSGCLLPCWWGIMPNSTTLLKAQNILSQFQSIGTYEYLQDMGIGNLDILYPSSNSNRSLRVRISFVPYPSTMNNVTYIKIDTSIKRKIVNGFQNIYDDKEYSEILSKYTLQGILSSYGDPSNIFTRLDINQGEDTAPDFFYIWLAYPEKGMYFRYEMLATANDKSAVFCPTQSFVQIWLLSPNEIHEHRDILSYASTDWKNIFSDPELFNSIEDTTNMTQTEFIDEFKRPTNTCLETPLSNWPIP